VKTVNYADSLVCQGLDKLEEKVPVIKKSPGEIKDAGWGTYDAVKSYGWNQLDSLKSFVSTQAEKATTSSYGQVVFRSVDTALEITESALDNYLPPGEGEETDQSDGANEGPNGGVPTESVVSPYRLVSKASRVSDKMRRRLIRTDLLLMKRALGLLKPVQQLTQSQVEGNSS
jgi:hypothetical protein